MTERKPPQPPPKTLADSFGGLVDRFVYAFAPERGVRRMAIRGAAERRAARNASTDGAESTQIRDGKWLGSRLSTDSVLELDLETLRRKSRELYRTDSIGGAVDSRTNLVVSYGFTPQARIKERSGWATQAQADKWNEELEEIFDRTQRSIGKNGKQSLWQLLRLVERCNAVDGESITIMSDRGSADRPIPLILEVVDADRLETPPGMLGNPRVRMGIEYDAGGRIVAYHIRNTHPCDTLTVDQTYTRYPADRVLHVFEPWFAGQSRGFPWMTRAINRLRDAKDLDEAAILAAQVEACYAAFVASPGGAYQSAAGATSETIANRRYEDIHPGTIRYLDFGETVTFGQPTKAGGYDPFQTWNYRRAAAGMNFPYEMVAKKWDGLSFAAGRLSLTDAKLFVKAQAKMLREAWLGPVWNRIVEESVIVGACSIPPSLYARAPWWFQRHEFNDPAWPYALTPGEEIDAAVKAVDNNLRTKASVIAEYGGNLEDVFAERIVERKQERDGDIEPAAAEVPSAELTPQKMEAVTQ